MMMVSQNSDLRASTKSTSPNSFATAVHIACPIPHSTQTYAGDSELHNFTITHLSSGTEGDTKKICESSSKKKTEISQQNLQYVNEIIQRECVCSPTSNFKPTFCNSNGFQVLNSTLKTHVCQSKAQSIPILLEHSPKDNHRLKPLSQEDTPSSLVQNEMIIPIISRPRAFSSFKVFNSLQEKSDVSLINDPIQLDKSHSVSQQFFFKKNESFSNENLGNFAQNEENAQIQNSSNVQTQPANFRYYTENDLVGLKKKLQLDSEGYLTRVADIQNGIVLKYSFRCKFDPQCPYQAVLSKTKNGFELNVIEKNHKKQCRLESDDLLFNQLSAKISADMPLLCHLVAADPRRKPKDILLLYAEQLGQTDLNFIYKGVLNKNKKRAIKKYFDNAVAKAKIKVANNK